MKRPHGRRRSHTLGPDGLNTIRLKAESNISDSNTQGEQSMEMPSSLKEFSESSSIVTDCSSDVIGLDDCSAVTCLTDTLLNSLEEVKDYLTSKGLLYMWIKTTIPS